MNTDLAVRARVEGKSAVARRTVWRLDVGLVTARCLRDGDSFVVQVRGPAGWNPAVGRGPDATKLLQAVARSPGVASAVAERSNP
jgi:hypothetical protein